MIEEVHISPEYIKSLNAGYIIAKHAPELAKQLRNVKGETPELNGLRDGIDSYIMEKHKIFHPYIIPHQIDKDEIDKGKDIEP